jgi:hypothetical protein
MKRIGLLDNLVHWDALQTAPRATWTAQRIMEATGGNTGNVAFVYGVRRLLANPLQTIGWRMPPEEAHRQLDHLVVCCANQLGAHVDLGNWADRLEALDLPVCLVGLGAQADSYELRPQIPAGTRRFLEVAKRLRAHPAQTNIAVRGTFTQQVLAELGVDSQVCGCPSGLIASEPALGAQLLQRQAQAPQPSAVLVAGGNPWHAPSAYLEPVLMQLASRPGHAYVLQHPELLFQLALGEMPSFRSALQSLLALLPGYDAVRLPQWMQQHARFFTDVPAWLTFCASHDLALGPRFHGVALAVQAGVPGCVFSIDSRTRELCEGTGIKHLPVDRLRGCGPDALVHACRWSEDDAQALDGARRRNRNAFVQFFNSNGLAPSLHLLNLNP